ncbi:MAG: transcription termination factor Rho, partial [Actinomycetota bacterium]|nr:transcription termination factor Rho [Actinomycetota bacterium]
APTDASPTDDATEPSGTEVVADPAGGDADGGEDDSSSPRSRGRNRGRGRNGNAAESSGDQSGSGDGEGSGPSGDQRTEGRSNRGGDANDGGQRGGSPRESAPQGGTPNDAGGQNGGGQQHDGGQNGGGQNGGGQNDGGQNDGGQQGEGQGDGQGESEGGRRRRRRRGRDRDRVEGEGGDGSQSWDGELIEVAGTLDLRDEGYGFLRLNGLLPSRDDVYVSVKQTRQFGLRRGDRITGASRPANRGEKNPALLRIDTVNDADADSARDRPHFEELTALFPQERLRLEREDHPYDMAARIIDLLAPIGKGQRGLIVSPPKAGKTTIMKTIAQAIEENHPEVEVMVLLVDERPEEVTDIRRSVSGEVVASTFDRPAEEHIAVAELAIERAKRMVELGHDIVVILDGITRLARAYNLVAPNGGRIMSGGIDTSALYPPKRFFGAARNLEEGGSLTILATALVETGSKMDEVIFEEFKGTGNMELRLDRAAAEQRVYPAINVDGSSTRHEELLIDAKQLQQVWKLRRLLSAVSSENGTAAGLELVIDRMRKFPTNEVFLAEIAKGPAIEG